jgi:predicted GH43/DUF377 family glycosyl hydrolase
MKSSLSDATVTVLSLAILAFSTVSRADAPPSSVLPPEAFRTLVDEFNSADKSKLPTTIANADAWSWMARNVPRFECPQRELQEIYYFRWWTYRKHVRQTPAGYVITEFLPDVPWAKKHNTISCAAGHHFYEGRWIRDPQYLDEYARFWFRGGGQPRDYSFWAADALYARYLAGGDQKMAVDLLPDLVNNYEAWEKTNYSPDVGLFHQIDDRDGMEFSIGGSGYRPTINSYMYGDAIAIARIADLAGKPDVATRFRDKAAQLKSAVQAKLWDAQAQFFKTSPDGRRLADVRELIGFVPWYFRLPDAHYATAWKTLMDEQGFYAPFGPTTAERRNPKFMFKNPHDCLWNGPSWPYATAQTLTAMANLLNDVDQNAVSNKDYLQILTNYARSQYKDGKPWIAEDLDARTGQWIVDLPRSVYYNHSTFCDLVITGLVGLRPRADDTVEINPLVPEGTWNSLCLDDVPYHGHSLTILYDKTGDRYRRGAGLRVFADGKQIAVAERIQRITGRLPPVAATAFAASDTNAGWVKYEHNPVLGDTLGTCFDVSVLKEGATYRMWFSWRPKKSIALVESQDGFHWSEPRIVVGPTSSGWEDDVNRPAVVKRPDGYHLWSTGQAKGQSRIGHATSKDGVTWTRANDKPVLSPEAKWEKVAVMCPDVMWDEEARQYRMWYSGGEQYEPDAIGYATSLDGDHWTKAAENPMFSADPKSAWEQHKVTACQVIKNGDWFYMFYIGFRDVDHAQIGLARSRDGVHNWQRHPANPIISPTLGGWDHDAVYKPSAIFDGERWRLWYNGRHGGVEQIGLATHLGEDLGFPNSPQ